MEIVHFIETVVIRALLWMPGLAFEKWLYKDDRLKSDIHVRPRHVGIECYHIFGITRITIYLEIINNSHYHSVELYPVSVNIGDLISASFGPQTLIRGKENNIRVETTLTDSQSKWLHDSKLDKLHINLLLAFHCGRRKIEAGYTFHNVLIAHSSGSS